MPTARAREAMQALGGGGGRSVPLEACAAANRRSSSDLFPFLKNILLSSVTPPNCTSITRHKFRPRTRHLCLGFGLYFTWQRRLSKLLITQELRTVRLERPREGECTRLRNVFGLMERKKEKHKIYLYVLVHPFPIDPLCLLLRQ